MRWRRNPDPLRHAEHAYFSGGPEEHARLLVARLRAGELRRDAVELAARLGHPAALLLLPDAELVDWEYWDQRRGAIRAAAKLTGGRRWQRIAVAFACDCAERVLQVFEHAHPDDDRPRRAIELARRWAEGEKVSQARLRAAADASASAAAYAASAAAYAAYDAAAADAAASYAADADAAWAASAAHAAPSAHSAAAFAAATTASEREWQRLRLAAYALGEA